MAASSSEGPGDLRRARGTGAHTLLIAHAGAVRTGTLAWVDHELAGGAKVLYKGWFGADRDPEGHWLLGSSAVPDALARGQLELVDLRTVSEWCGGSTDGLYELACDEVRSAMTAGWTSVAMTQETVHHRSAAAREAAGLADQDGGYERLARRWPVNTLCQVTADVEGSAAVGESIAVHHRDLEAGRWSARTDDGCWYLAGELDVAVAAEFGAAVRGAVAAAWAGVRVGRAHLHVDLAGVTFMDSACARLLLLAARSASRRRRLVLHRPSPVVRDLLAAVGLPRSAEIGAGHPG